MSTRRQHIKAFSRWSERPPALGLLDLSPVCLETGRRLHLRGCDGASEFMNRKQWESETYEGRGEDYSPDFNQMHGCLGGKKNYLAQRDHRESHLYRTGLQCISTCLRTS